jgi:hypothetical protein
MAVLGIDAPAAAEEPAGRGRYVRELLSALAERDDDHVYALSHALVGSKRSTSGSTGD